MVRAVAAALAAVGIASLASCSSVVDHIPASIGGLPEGTPERAATPAAYPAVHDIPNNRGPTVLSEAEKKRLRDDLSASRDRNVRDATSSPETIDIAPPAGAARN